MRVDGPAIMKAECESVLTIWAEGRTQEVVAAIVEDAHAHNDWLTDGAKRMIPSGPIACREGCSFCCHLRVVATIPEVLRIAAMVKSDQDAERAESLRRQVAHYRSVTKGLDLAGRRTLRVACPLLINGLCSVYSVRPMSCRGWNSLDVGGCEAHFLDPSRATQVPVYWPQHRISALVQEGMASGLDKAGLQHDRVELAEALGISLDVDDGADRWLRGERIFEAAIL